MINKDAHTRDNLRFPHEKSNVGSDEECRRIFREIFGFRKPEGEQFTAEELQQIFIYMEQDIFVGS